MEARIREHGLPADAANLRMLKAMGFSDARLATLTGKRPKEVAELRNSLNVRPVFKRIDTCAAEFASPTAYMYSTYETPFVGAARSEAQVSDRKKVVILGGGPNRIGQGIEFDYCCCHAAFALKDAGYEAIMINCNPETVSTDYDTSDRLYFEPLTAEDVIEILRAEQEKGEVVGVIVQFGGQTPLKLAEALEKNGIPILGTAPDMIDLAEDRDRFQKLLMKLDLNQPNNGIAYSVEQARLVAAEIGFPLVVRPSYVLGGRAMQIIHSEGRAADLPARHRAGTGAGRHQAALSERQDRPDQHAARQEPAALRQLPDQRHRGRRRLPLATARTSMSPASWSISRKPASIPATSACSLPPRSLLEGHARRTRAPDQGDGQGAQCRRPDERAVRHQGRHDLRARSQSARLAHRALRRQDHRRADRQDRRPRHGRRKARRRPSPPTAKSPIRAT